MGEMPATISSTMNIASIQPSSAMVRMDADGSHVKIDWDEVERQAAGQDPYLMPLAKSLLAARAEGVSSLKRERKVTIPGYYDCQPHEDGNGEHCTFSTTPPHSH